MFVIKYSLISWSRCPPRSLCIFIFVYMTVPWILNAEHSKRLHVQSFHINAWVKHWIERLCALHTEGVKESHSISIIEWQLPLLEIAQHSQLSDFLSHWQLLLLGIMTCHVLPISVVDAPGSVVHPQSGGILTGSIFFIVRPSGHTNQPVGFLLDNHLPVVLPSSKAPLSHDAVLGVIWLGAQGLTARLSSPAHLPPVLGYFQFWMSCLGVQSRRT